MKLDWILLSHFQGFTFLKGYAQYAPLIDKLLKILVLTRTVFVIGNILSPISWNN